MDDPRTNTRYIKRRKRCAKQADTGSVAGGTETEYFRNPLRVVVTRNKGVCKGEARENIANGGARKKERETGMEIEIKRGTRSREITRRG